MRKNLPITAAALMFGLLLGCSVFSEDSALRSCRPEINTLNNFPDLKSEASDSDLLAYEDSRDGLQIVFVEQTWNKFSNSYLDDTPFKLWVQPVALFESRKKQYIGQDEYGNSEVKQVRQATIGDRKRLEHGVKAQQKLTAVENCVFRACQSAQELKNKAQRLFSLHSSEDTARELVQAEARLAECKKIK